MGEQFAEVASSQEQRYGYAIVAVISTIMNAERDVPICAYPAPPEALEFNTGSTLKSLNPKISVAARNLNRLAPSLRLGPNRWRWSSKT